MKLSRGVLLDYVAQSGWAILGILILFLGNVPS